VEQIFRATEFLEYGGSEQQLIDRIVMNLHLSMLAHAAFIDRPQSTELYNSIGVIEERSSVIEERWTREEVARSLSVGQMAACHVSCFTPRRVRPLGAGLPKCWGCGQSGHVRRDCPRKSLVSGNRSLPGGC
jgi:hypothetical protein